LSKPRNRKKRKAVQQKKQLLEVTIRNYLEDQSPVPPVRCRNSPGQVWPTAGSTWDLKEVFETLNRTYFENALLSLLRWGATASKTSYQTTRKDSEDRPWHCITIAGVYNHPEVPRFAIESIMYHEMLHIHIPPRKVQGRNVFHGPDFREKEQAFPHYPRWVKWEHDHFHRLYSLMRRKAKREQKSKLKS
jgi:hypothetical protein